MFYMKILDVVYCELTTLLQHSDRRDTAKFIENGLAIK
jgi:hypothetical protein